MWRHFFILVAILVGLMLIRSYSGLIENASGSVGTITQLNASNIAYVGNIRPVRQRGMFFNNPSWNR